MKIGFNCSCFDLFHAGHVTMLKMEKEMCDYLKVALQVDPTIDRPSLKNKPVQSIYERYAQVQGCKYVDEDIDVTGKQYCIDNDIEIHYHLRRHQFSTTELRNRVYELEKAKREEKDIIDIKQYSPELLEKYGQK